MALLTLYNEVLSLDDVDLALYGVYDARNSRIGGGSGSGTANKVATGKTTNAPASGKASR